MERRREPRIKKRLNIKVGANGDSPRVGLTGNLSCQGMCISLNSAPKSRNLTVEISTGTQRLDIKGHCQWAKRTISGFANQVQLGVRILDAPPEYYQLFCSPDES